MAAVDFKNLKVLVVEDDKFVRMMIIKYLQDFGVVEVHDAANGVDAVPLLRQKPDIIICDINMKPLNGFEFLKHVRQMGQATSKVPFIFLTGDERAEYVQQAAKLAANGYLLKPVTAEILKDKIIFLLSQPKAAGAV